MLLFFLFFAFFLSFVCLFLSEGEASVLWGKLHAGLNMDFLSAGKGE